MTVRDELVNAIKAVERSDDNAHSLRMEARANDACTNLLRDHGPALVELADADAKYREISSLIGRIFFYGNFKAETYNERELEKLLRETGNFYETEAEALQAIDRGRGVG